MRRLLIALLAAALLVVAAPPPEAAAAVRLTASDTTPTVGQRVTLTAKVGAPRRKVVFQQRVGSTWRELARTRSDSRGTARAVVRFQKAGRVTVRAVAGRAQDALVLDVRKARTTISATVAPGPWTVGYPVVLPVEVAPPASGRKVWLERRDGETWVRVTPQLSTSASGAAKITWTPPEVGTETLRLRVAATATHLEATTSPVEREIVPEAGGFVFDGGLESTHEGRDAPDHTDQIFGWGCVGGVQPPAGAVPSYAVALQQAKAYVASRMTDQTDAWEGLAAQDDPALLDEVIAIAIADNRPDAALAAALRAHELRPNDGVHLSNAAAAANLVNHPEWAIAFATEAAKSPASSVGVRQEAVRLVNLGHAHALRGNRAQAIQLLQQAVAVDPASQAVRAELAAVLACEGRTAEALPHVRRSLRTDEAADPIELDNGEPESRRTLIDTSTLYDLSGGVDQSLTLPHVPGSWHELNARSEDYGNGYYRQQYEEGQDYTLDLVMRANQLESQLAQRKQGWAPARRRVVEDILRRIGSSYDREITQAWEDYRDVAETVIRINNCLGRFADHPFCGDSSETPTCALTQSLFNEWLRAVQAAGDALSAYHDAAAEHFSGLQALLSDPVAHQLAGVRAELEFRYHVDELVANMWITSRELSRYNENWKDRDREKDPPCVGGLPVDMDPPVKTERTAASICSEDSPISRLDLNLDLEVVAVQLDCEGWQVEVSRGVPWLEAFASVSGGWNGTNGIVVNVGVRAGVAGVGIEGALYWEQDGQGKVKDYGWQVGSSLELGGVVSVTPYEDTVKVSIMSAFTTGH